MTVLEAAAARNGRVLPYLDELEQGCLASRNENIGAHGFDPGSLLLADAPLRRHPPSRIDVLLLSAYTRTAELSQLEAQTVSEKDTQLPLQPRQAIQIRSPITTHSNIRQRRNRQGEAGRLF
jgi:hypothetical protein